MPTDEKLKELQTQHGDIVAVATPLGTLYFRTPSQDEHERWVEKIAGDAKVKMTATREYVLSALVYPSREQAISFFEKKPAVPTKLAGKLSELAGTDIEIEVKKA